MRLGAPWGPASHLSIPALLPPPSLLLSSPSTEHLILPGTQGSRAGNDPIARRLSATLPWKDPAWILSKSSVKTLGALITVPCHPRSDLGPGWLSSVVEETLKLGTSRIRDLICRCVTVLRLLTSLRLWGHWRQGGCCLGKPWRGLVLPSLHQPAPPPHPHISTGGRSDFIVSVNAAVEGGRRKHFSESSGCLTPEHTAQVLSRLAAPPLPWPLPLLLEDGA